MKKDSLKQMGALPSQIIRSFVKEGKIISKYDEDKIQPASFEPTLSNEIYFIDTSNGLFRPSDYKRIFELIEEFPKRYIKKYSAEGGFELRAGSTYLIRLNERLSFLNDIFVKSSPKSSFGRLFVNTRLLADYNSGFDEIQTIKDKEIDLWLLVQPLTFNILVYPGISLNQLRFFKGGEELLNYKEISNELKRGNLISRVNSLNKWVINKQQNIFNSLRIHLDLSNSVAGLIARKVWEPVDTMKKNYYEVEDFFNVIKAPNRRVRIDPNQYCLFVSKEFLKIPPYLSAELRSHSYLGLDATLHFAGFIDNGFSGQLVLEVSSNELSPVLLDDNMPISKLDFYKTVEEPDKIYGSAIGSNYQEQVGIRPAKFFKKFDLNDLKK